MKPCPEGCLEIPTYRKEIYDRKTLCILCGNHKAKQLPWRVVDGDGVATRWICHHCGFSWTISNFTGTIDYWMERRRPRKKYVSKEAPIGCLLVVRSKRIE